MGVPMAESLAMRFVERDGADFESAKRVAILALSVARRNLILSGVCRFLGLGGAGGFVGRWWGWEFQGVTRMSDNSLGLLTAEQAADVRFNSHPDRFGSWRAKANCPPFGLAPRAERSGFFWRI